MRVLFVIPFFAPAWGFGGPPRVSYEMARRLVRIGYEVDVLTTDVFDRSRRLPAGPDVLDGIRIHRLPNVSNTLAGRFNGYLPVGFSRTMRTLVAQKDIVHLFDFRSYLNARAHHILQRCPIPYVLSAFGELSRATGPKRPLKLAFDIAFGYALLRNASALLAQTKDEAAWYCRLGADPSQVKLMPLAVDLEPLSRLPAKGTFRQRYGIDATDHVILFLGRIHQYKGLDLLIRSFAQLAPGRSNLWLVIAGRDDGYEKRARALASMLAPQGRVLFTGEIYGDERFAAYQDADIFAITPSHTEQTSLASLEACACGVPTVVTDQAPIPGLHRAGAGITVHRDIAALTGALALLLDDEALRKEMGRRAAQLVREQFSWEAVIGRLTDIYGEAVSSAGKTRAVLGPKR